MSNELHSDDDQAAPPASDAPAAARKRPKPGERRVQILQALAAMLEQPGAERITTAALAARLTVSEAALYRHFASKAQMFEGLIEFIEQSLFTLANQIMAREADPAAQISRVISMALQFFEKNPGMARVFEHERLAQRMNQCTDRLESLLRQSHKALAEARRSASPTVDAQAGASLAITVVLGRLQRFVRSGFKRLPTEHLDGVMRQLLA
jgi:TetR/AcrR family transcriptional regulator